jgi:serine/threonine protein kinase
MSDVPDTRSDEPGPLLEQQTRLWRAVAGAGLVEPERLRQLEQELAGRSLDAVQLGRELIQRGLLTAFQVTQVLRGQEDSLAVGPYRLLDRLGAGGMGEVFKARHSRLGKVVALKLIHPNRLGNPALARRFLREVQSASRLDHPNIVHAIDAGEADGRLYLALEFIDGADLARLVKDQGALPPGQACECIRQVALALAHAHEKGLVHRDIKPGNLLLSQDGTVKLLDLGLAQLGQPASGDSTSLTDTGAVMGTPDFMAPEQIRDSKRVDIRADLYSLGCTLYFLLAGRPPFPGGSVGHKLLRQQDEEPESLESLRRDVPVALVGVVRKLMAKRPEDRFQTPAELVAELERIMVRGRWRPATSFTSLSQEETAVVDSSWQLWGRHLRPRWLLAGGLAVVLCLGLTTLLWMVSRTSPKQPDDPGKRPAERPPITALADLRSTDVPQQERFGWQPKGLVQVLGTHHGGRSWHVMALAVSADGKYAATSGQQRLVQVWDTRTLGMVRSFWMPELTTGLGFTDQALMSSHWDGLGYRVSRTPLDGSRPTRYPRGFWATHFSPDGRRALLSNGGVGVLYDTATGEKLLEIKGRKGDLGPLGAAFSRDGKQALLAGREEGDIVRLDTADGKVLQTYAKAHASRVLSLAFLPDGRRFLSGGSSDGVKCFSVGDRPAHSEVLAASGQIVAIAVSPDGKRAIWSEYGPGRIAVANLEGKARPVSHAPTTFGVSWQLAFLPDGRRALLCNSVGRLALWDSQTGKHLLPDQGPPGPVNGVAFAPGGDRGAACSDLGWLATWDVLSGKQLLARPTGPVSLAGVSFSPDGRRLVCIEGYGKVVLRDPASDARDKAFETGLGFGKAVAAGKELIFAGGGMAAPAGKVPSKDCAVRVFDYTGKERFRCAGHTTPVSALAISADGNWLLTGSYSDSGVDEYPVRLWDARTGKQRIGVRLDTGVRAVAVAADGHWGVSGNDGGAVHVYDFDLPRGAGKPTRALWHGTRVHGVVITPAGRIVSAGVDGRVLVWTREGKLEGEWVLPGPVYGLALARDGKHVATANSNGTVYVLRLPAPAPRKKP